MIEFIILTSLLYRLRGYGKPIGNFFGRCIWGLGVSALVYYSPIPQAAPWCGLLAFAGMWLSHGAYFHVATGGPNGNAWLLDKDDEAQAMLSLWMIAMFRSSMVIPLYTFGSASPLHLLIPMFTMAGLYPLCCYVAAKTKTDIIWKQEVMTGATVGLVLYGAIIANI